MKLKLFSNNDRLQIYDSWSPPPAGPIIHVARTPFQIPMDPDRYIHFNAERDEYMNGHSIKYNIK